MKKRKLPPLSDLVPTTWLDPLLTGPNKVIADGFEFTPKDIERLLLALKGRIQEEEYAVEIEYENCLECGGRRPIATRSAIESPKFREGDSEAGLYSIQTIEGEYVPIEEVVERLNAETRPETRRMPTEEQVEAAAKYMADCWTIEPHNLGEKPWRGTARAILEAAFAVAEERRT